MEDYEQKTGLHERPKGKSRTEAPLLPAPGENAGAPDTGADPQGPHPSSLYARRDARKFSDLPRRADGRPGDGAAETFILSTGGLALPKEVPPEQYLQVIWDYCEKQYVSKGMIADFAIYGTDPAWTHYSRSCDADP